MQDILPGDPAAQTVGAGTARCPCSCCVCPDRLLHGIIVIRKRGSIKSGMQEKHPEDFRPPGAAKPSPRTAGRIGDAQRRMRSPRGGRTVCGLSGTPAPTAGGAARSGDRALRGTGEMRGSPVPDQAGQGSVPRSILCRNPSVTAVHGGDSSPFRGALYPHCVDACAPKHLL